MGRRGGARPLRGNVELTGELPKPFLSQATNHHNAIPANKDRPSPQHSAHHIHMAAPAHNLVHPALFETPEPPAEFGQDGGKFYRCYDALAEEIDEDMTKGLKEQLDGLLIFVSPRDRKVTVFQTNTYFCWMVVRLGRSFCRSQFCVPCSDSSAPLTGSGRRYKRAPPTEQPPSIPIGTREK